jgi:hypothetical protein
VAGFRAGWMRPPRRGCWTCSPRRSRGPARSGTRPAGSPRASSTSRAATSPASTAGTGSPPGRAPPATSPRRGPSSARGRGTGWRAGWSMVVTARHRLVPPAADTPTVSAPLSWKVLVIPPWGRCRCRVCAAWRCVEAIDVICCASGLRDDAVIRTTGRATHPRLSMWIRSSGQQVPRRTLARASRRSSRPRRPEGLGRGWTARGCRTSHL